MRLSVTPALHGSVLVRFVTALFAALLMVTSTHQAFAVEIQKVQSKRGITAYLVEDYTVPIIAVAGAFRGGSTQDAPGQEGAVQLMIALMDEGAGPLDAKAFQAEAEETGVELGFSAYLDEIGFSTRTLKSEQTNAFRLLRLALNEPRFDAEAISRMRDAIRSQLESAERNPSAVARKIRRETLFKGHPYARNVAGTLASIDRISREELVSMHAKLMARDNLTIGVVGAINAEELMVHLDEVFGDLPETAELEPVADIEPTMGVDSEHFMPSPQAQISFIYPGLKREDPDFFAAHLVAHMLGGGGFSSRLYQEVREKRGLVYGISAWLSTFRHSAYLTIQTSTRNERLEETISVIREEVERLADGEISAAELEAARQYVLGSYAINNLDTSLDIAGVLVTLQTQNLGIDYLTTREADIKKVTVEDVNRLAGELLGAEPSIFVVRSK